MARPKKETVAGEGANVVVKTAPQTTVTVDTTSFKFNQLQVLVGESDSLDVALDSTGKLVSGAYLSAQTFVNEVNRLIKSGLQIADIVVFGMGTVGVTAGKITIKTVFQSPLVGRRQERFGLVVMPEDGSNQHIWNASMAQMGKDGFELFKVVPLGVQQQSTNSMYVFIKYAA